jgi:hypothetical protein
MSSDFKSQIHLELGDLRPDAQERVLEYVRALKRLGNGMSAEVLRKHVGRIAPADAQSMRDAIELGCEQVNTDEW